MTKLPIIDAEFSVVEPRWKLLSRHISTLIAAVVVVAAGVWIGAGGESGSAQRIAGSALAMPAFLAIFATSWKLLLALRGK